MHTTEFNWKIVSISDSAWTHGLNSSTHMALICNIATGTFFKALPLFCPAVSFNFAEARRYPIILPITFIWNFKLNFSIDVVQKSNNLQNVTVANLRGSKEQQPPECYSRKPTWFERVTTSRMLQSQTYVVRKSNDLQNVAVANIRGSKE